MSEALAHKFQAFFAGLTRAHGIYPPLGEPDAKGKRKATAGKPDTPKSPVTLALWERHLAGEQRIGIIPIRDDNTCMFGALDWDIYPVDHAALAQKLADHYLPMLLTRSKSGGAHLWLFADEPVPAATMRRRLGEIRKILGLPDKTEIFPKQYELVPTEEDPFPTGNWINMPYCGNDPDVATHAIDATGRALSAEEFIQQAEMFEKPLSWFNAPLPTAATEESPVALTKKKKSRVPAAEKPHRAHMDPLVTGNIENGLFSELGRIVAQNKDISSEILEVHIEAMLDRCEPRPEPSDCARLRKQLRKFGLRFVEKKDKEHFHNFTVTGNAWRFLEYHGDEYLFNTDNKKWMTYNPGSALWDPAPNLLWLLATDISRTLIGHEQVLAENWIKSEDSATRERGEWLLGEVKAWIKTCEGDKLPSAVLKLLSAHTQFTVCNADFDKDDTLCHCQNGMLDPCTGELLPHSPAYRCLRSTKVSFDINADRAEWDAFVKRCLPDDELRAFFQEWCGTFLLGVSVPEIIGFIHGLAATGKTTIMEAIANAMGTYAKNTSANTLVTTKNPSHPTELAVLEGMRFVYADEFTDDVTLDTARLKMLTGGGKVAARRMNQDMSEFKPKFNLAIVADSDPKLSFFDTGIWRRLLRIPFTQIIPPDQRDKEKKERLLNPLVNGPAVLAWMVEGCMRWHARGRKFIVPASVTQATEDYRENFDTLKEMLEDYTVAETGATVSTSILYPRYKSYAEHCGIRNFLTLPAFTKEMKKHGFPCIVKRSGDTTLRVYTGIKMKPLLGSGNPGPQEPGGHQEKIPFEILDRHPMRSVA